MSKINKNILKLLSTEAFQLLVNNDAIKIEQLITVIRLLIAAGVPFDLSFDPGNRRDSTSAALIIFINPTTTIDFTISLESGQSVFTPT